MKILAGDDEGDTFRVNLSLSTKNPTEQKTGFFKKPVFSDKWPKGDHQSQT